MRVESMIGFYVNELHSLIESPFCEKCEEMNEEQEIK